MPVTFKMQNRDIIVVGASAGGREAITEFCRTLSPELPASIFIVWHMPASGVGMLPRMLARVSPLPAQDAVDGQPIQPGHIYVAPVDHHLLVEQNYMRVTKGPRENRFRPAVDPLFRSAAYAYGPRVIGIILSGALNDGTSGLWAIKDRGGIAIVQDPGDALVSGMPLSALENVEVDYRVSVGEMAELVARLVKEPVPELERTNGANTLGIEVKIAKERLASNREMNEIGIVSEFTCPECHGTLWQMYEGNLLRFRCRTGHAYTAQALLEDITESVEAMHWATIRGMEETAVLLKQMSEHVRENGNVEMAKRFLEESARVNEKIEAMRKTISTDVIDQTAQGSGTMPI